MPNQSLLILVVGGPYRWDQQLVRDLMVRLFKVKKPTFCGIDPRHGSLKLLRWFVPASEVENLKQEVAAILGELEITLI